MFNFFHIVELLRILFVCLPVYSYSYAVISTEHRDYGEIEVLSKRVGIACWISTSHENHNQARFIKTTWGQRCSQLVFVSTNESEELPAITVEPERNQSNRG